MGLCYMAMSGQELAEGEGSPDRIAWLSCHFSPRGDLLSNLPEKLPPQSLLVLDDLIPPQDQRPEVIAGQLSQLSEALQLSGILLDFQRPDRPQTTVIARHLCRTLPCPVILAQPYAQAGDGPVLLPPPPLHKPLEVYVAPWEGRQLWLEAATGTQRLTLTEQGCQIGPLEPLEEVPLPFADKALFCSYAIEIQKHAVTFSLSRTQGLLKELLKKAEELGITTAIGMYQELK